MRAYIAERRDAPVAFEFSVNEKNVGWKASFKNLILRSEATFIFPCNQDDIWNPDKIANMVEVRDVCLVPFHV